MTISDIRAELDRLDAENAKLQAVADAARRLAEEDDRDVCLTDDWNALDSALAALDAPEQLPVADCQLPAKAEEQPCPACGAPPVLDRTPPQKINPIQGVVSMSIEMKSYVICRTARAGVFAGTLESREEGEVVLSNARRLWYWSGAASLSEMAVKGVSDPARCKFPIPVSHVLLLEAIEILPCTAEARKSIEEVPVWSAH